jgi:1,4-dihydroxy-2-naphthoate octaprenyltransferase
MGIATFKTVAAGDGSPQSPSGYALYLLVHAIATALLLIALVAAIWKFMDWVAAPPCTKASLASVSSSQRYAALADTDCPCPHERQRHDA